MTNYDAGDVHGAWSEATGGWLRFWTRLTESFIESQRATAAAFGLAAIEPGDGSGGEAASPLPSMTYAREDWVIERSVDSIADLSIGDSVSFSKSITDADVRAFARASGDTNRLHLDDAFAAETRFGERIVHGTLVAGLISAALARFPGVTIYLSQDVRYLRPVKIGDALTADCEIVEDLGDGRYRLVTVVTDEAGETVIDGEAVVLIEAMQEGAAET